MLFLSDEPSDKSNFTLKLLMQHLLIALTLTLTIKAKKMPKKSRSFNYFQKNLLTFTYGYSFRQFLHKIEMTSGGIIYLLHEKFCQYMKINFLY
jgi:hypothetical protein